jgi:hypothetical protein
VMFLLTRYVETIRSYFGGVVGIRLVEPSPKVIRRFMDNLRQQADLYHLGDSIAEYVGIRFHGTLKHFIPSIFNMGLLPPGTDGVVMRNGASYGQGIYTATSPQVSMSYTGGEQVMLLCAVLDDEPLIRDFGSRNHDGSKAAKAREPMISKNGDIHVVRSPSYVLPFAKLYYDVDWSSKAVPMFSANVKEMFLCAENV